MKLKKESILNFIKAVIFLTILFLFFLFFTYLFRNNGEGQRGNILGYYEEEENSLDVVFVGASNVVRYWNPMRAYEQYGFTSRNYATVSMRAVTYLYALKDALRTQDPELVVMEARLFTRDYSSKITVGAQNFFDSLDISPFRCKAIQYYCDVLDLSWDEAVLLYFDLIYYHDNYAALTNPVNWSLADNRLDKGSETAKFFKGYSLSSALYLFDDPSGNITDECGEVDSIAMELYVDIIEYCKSNDIPLMFVATPIVTTEDEEKRFNTLAQVAESYGVEFVNTNRFYEEMGLDFTQDFYDDHHVNILGADKFTDYFAAYLNETYDLPDHRGEDAYASWDVRYEEYLVESDKSRQSVLDKIATNEEAWEAEAKMLHTKDPMEWLSLGEHSGITLFALAGEPCEYKPSAETKLILGMFGVPDSYLNGGASFKAIYNNELIYSNDEQSDKAGKVGTAEIRYTLSTKKAPSLVINKVEYYDVAKGDIQLVAFDNNKNEVVDVVYMSVAEDGMLLMER